MTVHKRSVGDAYSIPAAVGGGVSIGALGGLIGLGGAEFRLPLLLSVFGFEPLEAVILNKAMSLVVVATALPFRAAVIPVTEVAAHWSVIVNLLAGSLVGAWFGASWATRLRSETLYRVIAGVLLIIAVVLATAHNRSAASAIASGPLRFVVGVFAGFGIGCVASLLGVAGGEFLIPTLTLLFGIDIKLAGSLSLAISLPTMIVGFARYSRDESFSIIRRRREFLLVMAVASSVGTFIGGRLLGLVPESILLPLLAAILVLSAVKIWRHSQHAVQPAGAFDP